MNLEKYSDHSNDGNLYNMTINNHCSNCGNCCGLFIPFTKKELFVIQDYVEDHKIEPVDRITDHGFEAHCCFYDPINKKCNIYEVRPYVCKDFICNRKNWKEKRNDYERRAYYNSTLSKKRVIGTFDDLVYYNYQPILLYIFNVVRDFCKGPVDTDVLLRFLKNNNRLDLLKAFRGQNEKGEWVDGKDLLKEI